MARFQSGQKVEKTSGYRFPGIVLDCVAKTNGLEVYLVEADHPDFTGMVHVFNENQLVERRNKVTLPPMDVGMGELWRHASGTVYIVTQITIDKHSLEWCVSYTIPKSTAVTWTQRYDVFKQHFMRVS